jgi:2,3-dihydroxyphenylpropionate 1,2-dioxygenase
MSSILGGAMVPHAPQFFTLPETESKATVERVRQLQGEIGAKLKALQPDLWVVIANDHANQFLLHCVPAFALHVGREALGEFAGRVFRHTVASDTAFDLVRALQAAGFDPAFCSTAAIDYAFGIPLTFLGVDQPILPLYVNAYVPPQPSIERCYAFGQALERGLAALGRKAVIVASGGMSHFPGTERYGAPDLAFDQALLERLKSGNLRALLGYDAASLDATGNVELRCWAVAAGALGERVPDLVSMDPSWHHNYATLGWYTPPAGHAGLHYPAVAADRVALTDALHRLANDADARARFQADPEAFVRGFDLPGEQAQALAALDLPALVRLGVHPLVPFLAELQIKRQRAR